MQKKLRILFNSDGGTPVFYHFKAPMSRRQLCRVINGLRGTQVDVFVPCVQHGDDQFYYPTKVGEIYDGRYIKDGEFGDPILGRAANNVKSLLERGIDPVEVWTERAHELGMEIWPSLRMNDLHKDTSRFATTKSQWELQHRHLLIGKDVPKGYGKPFTWAMNYAEEEVRRRKLAIIEEVCTDYDVDGFEMDFLRSPSHYFRRGQERAGMPLMNDLVRKVRAMMDRIADARGRKLTLAVRVPTHLEYCERIGLDPRTWFREGLVDWVIPMAPGYLDMNADVRSFVKLARGTTCRVAGGLEFYQRNYATDPNKPWAIGQATIELLRAAASGYWQEGARGIYLFNYDCHGPFPLRGKKRQALREIGDPATLAGKDKHYVVTLDMRLRTPEAGGDKQLPADLAEDGAERRFTFTIGDDLASAEQEGLLHKLTLRVTFDKGLDIVRLVRIIRFRLNGRMLQNGSIRKGSYEFRKVLPLKKGANDLVVSLHPPGDRLPAALIRIRNIEVLIKFRPNKAEQMVRSCEEP